MRFEKYVKGAGFSTGGIRGPHAVPACVQVPCWPGRVGPGRRRRFRLAGGPCPVPVPSAARASRFAFPGGGFGPVGFTAEITQEPFFSDSLFFPDHCAGTLRVPLLRAEGFAGMFHGMFHASPVSCRTLLFVRAGVDSDLGVDVAGVGRNALVRLFWVFGPATRTKTGVSKGGVPLGSITISTPGCKL